MAAVSRRTTDAATVGTTGGTGMYGFGQGFWGYNNRGGLADAVGEQDGGVMTTMPVPQPIPYAKFFQRFSQIPEGYDSPFAQMYKTQQQQMGNSGGVPQMSTMPVPTSGNPMDSFPGFGYTSGTPRTEGAPSIPQSAPQPQPTRVQQLEDMGYSARPRQLDYWNSQQAPAPFSYTAPSFNPGFAPQGMLPPNGYSMNKPQMTPQGGSTGQPGLSGVSVPDNAFFTTG